MLAAAPSAVAADRDVLRDAAGTDTAPPSVSRRLSDALPAGARLLTSQGGDRQRNDSVTDIASAMRHYHDTGAWLATLQELIEQATGTPAVALAARDGHAPQETTDDDPDAPAGAVLAALAAGDLDGDGADDIILLTIDVATGGVVAEARRGSDSALIWQRDAGGDGALAWPLAHDVDGDGVDDVSLYGLDIHDESVVEECETFDDEEWCWPTEYHATFTWTLGVASGTDGTPLWTRTFAGHLDEVYAWTYEDDALSSDYSDRYELESTNLYVIDLYAGDLTGTATDELVIDAIDLNVVEAYEGSSTGPVGTEQGSLQVRAQTRADVVEAATGNVRQTLTDAAAGRISFLSPAADSVGGPQPDLLWDTTVAPDQAYECMYVDVVVDWVTHCPQEAPGGWALELAMLDGDSLQPAWSITVPDGWFGFSLGEDLDADGRSDVMVMADDFQEYSTLAVSGATGEALWEHRSPEDWLSPIVIDPLDAVAGDDLVTVSIEWGDLTGGETAIVVGRRSGLTGEVLATERHALPSDDEGNGSFTGIYAAGEGDGTGDGTGDLTFGWVRATYDYDDETGEEQLLSLDSSGQAQSGRTGETVRELAMAGDFALLLPVDDLDGDGLVDLVEERYAYDEATAEELVAWSFSPFSAGPGRWTVAAEGGWVWLDVAGDLDGDGGHDLLITTDDYSSPVISSTVRALAGAGGSELWTLSTR
jgi:hypothetical protein